MSDDFSQVEENLKRIIYNLNAAMAGCGRENDSVRLMAVTKTVAPEKVNFAVSKGISLLGENRVQEFLQKKEEYAENTEIHFIGHLQTNKIKYIIDDVDMIESVDSLRLAEEISELAIKKGRVMDILCEVNIGNEASKSGFSPDGLDDVLCQVSRLKGLRLRGLMTIPPPSESCVFLEKMQRVYQDAAAKHSGLDILSMGMSDDYADAVRFGSTLVRIGSALFGKRDYSIS